MKLTEIGLRSKERTAPGSSSPQKKDWSFSIGYGKALDIQPTHHSLPTQLYPENAVSTPEQRRVEKQILEHKNRVTKKDYFWFVR